MAGHDIIVMGASAGGIEALSKVIGGLAPELPAAIFVVQHVPANGMSQMPAILQRAGPFAASHAVDGERIAQRHISVAPPDHHLLIERGHLHVVRGPKENGFRPAIDATFRTAARAYGPRVVGVVLTGMLDDGTAGLLAIKRRGGGAIVQAPAEALFPSMPQSALRYAEVDAVLSLAEIPALLLQLAHEPAADESEVPVSDSLDIEASISGMGHAALDQADELSTPAPYSCPDCGGVLGEFYDGDLLRFRCQVGHVYSRESLVARQNEALDVTLWAAYRALNERATLARRLVRDAQRLSDAGSERRFAQLIDQAEQQKEQLRQVLLVDEPARRASDR